MRAVRADTPVILSSGYNEVEATHRLVGRGNVDFLQKPYSVRDLLDLAARLLGARAPG
jgi:FixJ family two-component response regulator